MKFAIFFALFGALIALASAAEDGNLRAGGAERELFIKKLSKKADKAAKKAAKEAKKAAKKAEKEAKKAAKKAAKDAKKAGGGAKNVAKKIFGGKKSTPRAGPTPAVNGDPHFVMWSGERFDFHGGCDLVLLQDPEFNNGEGLYIHIRTKIQRWWSYVESAVVQIGNDTLEVMGGIENKRYFVNGKPGDKLDVGGMMPFTIGGYPVRYRHLNDKQFQLKIFLENNQNIVLKAVKDFMRVDVENPTVESFGTSVGLMGSYEGGKKLGRDGVTVIEDNNDFGKEWQVLRTEPMLFHNVEGVQHPETCAMPTVTEDKRRLEGSISREQAEIACAKVSPDDMKNCVYDVMATNDVDMAGTF